MKSLNPQFDRLFAFGIDPDKWQFPSRYCQGLASEAEILNYNTSPKVIDTAVDTPASIQTRTDLLFRVAIEHRFMHVETLGYIFCMDCHIHEEMPLVVEAPLTPPSWSVRYLFPAERRHWD